MGYLQMLLAPWGFSGWLLLKLIELLLLPFLILLRLFITRSHSPIDTPKPREQLSEETRLAECREVVLGFAHTMGYIAREVISRQELEEKIDRGISATDLAAEIGARITAFPGIILGQDRNLPVPVKLPQTYRNRHTYIIGKSGSGKTNFLRNMMSQDIADGAGIAVLAPEQELLTDELLPYIPDHRIDDVV